MAAYQVNIVFAIFLLGVVVAERVRPPIFVPIDIDPIEIGPVIPVDGESKYFRGHILLLDIE